MGYVCVTHVTSIYPFGSPDAATEAIEPSEFVTVDGSPEDAGMASARADPGIRVLVGRMGAGKTRCLLEVERDLRAAGACDLTRIEFDLPSLTHVTRLAEDLAIEPVERGEIWRKIWKCAIVRSALSQVLPRADDARDVSELATSARRLREIGPPLVSTSSVPQTIYAAFGGILRDHPTIAQIRGFLDDPGWEQIDYGFERLLEQRDIPLCFFLDTGEEDSSHAPRYWLWCQLGLVRQVLTYAQNDRLAEKLCVFIAIREQVWVELRNLQPTLLENHPNVRILRWDAPVPLEFFADKIRLLPEEYRLGEIDPDAESSDVVAAWLGSARVPNSIRPLEESTAEYILRHTRLVPRDIICVGNFLAGEVFAARSRGDSSVADERIHLAVADAARTSGWEELEWCALDLIGSWLAGARTRPERHAILADEESHRTVARGLGDLLGLCSADVVEDTEFDVMADEASGRFGRPVDLSHLLWRHGLIGFGHSPEGPFQFAHETRLSGRDAAPPPGTHIALHPALIDAVGVAPAGEKPVYPFAEDLLCSTRT